MPDLSAYDPVFEEAGREWNVDPRLLKAIAAQESQGDPRAVSKAGAQGLMQIIPSTQKQLGVTEPFDPVQSIWGGAKYLATALDAEKTPQAALLYYHGGPDWRQNFGQESAAYVPSVAAKYAALAPKSAGVQVAKANTGTATDATSSAESDTEFLKRTATTPAAEDKPKVESDSAFLGRTGAKEKAPPPPETEQDPLSGSYLGGKLPPEPSRVVGLETPEGWERANILPLARNPATGEMAPAIPGFIRDPIVGLTTQGPQMQGNALVVPGATISPQTGTFGLTPEAAAAGSLAVNPLRFGGNALELQAPGLLTRKAPLQMEEGQLLAPGATARAAERADRIEGTTGRPAPSVAVQVPGVPPPAPAAVASSGGPQSVGAAASREGTPPGMIGLTPKEEAAYRATAEGQKLLEPQQPGIPDRNSYVPGVTPNAAEQEQTATMARELKSLGVSSPEATQVQREAAAANNEARTRYFQDTARSPVDIQRAQADLAQQDQQQLAQVWRNKGTADTSPVTDAADAIKGSDDWKRPAVRDAVNSVLKEMEGETDPQMLYGVRKHIDDMLSKEGQRQTPLSARATASLQVLKQALDQSIEGAAPGFRQYLADHATAAKRIDEMQVLQDFEPKLFDSQNRMTYNQVQRMMKNIVDMRNAPGINPYKSITDETMLRLWNLRDDLRRSASAMELARAAGSDTAANAVDLAKQYVKLGGVAGAHAVANYISPGLGSLAIQGIQGAARPITAAIMARRQAVRAQELLNPQNALRNPNAP